MVEVSRAVARRAASIRADAGIGLIDAIVAATAVTEGCSVLVSNDRKFRRLAGEIRYVHLDDHVAGGLDA